MITKMAKMKRDWQKFPFIVKKESNWLKEDSKVFYILSRKRRFWVKRVFKKPLIKETKLLWYVKFKSCVGKRFLAGLTRILLTETLNNFYVNVINLQGQTLYGASAGQIQHRNRKGNPTIDQLSIQLMVFLKGIERQRFLIVLKSKLNGRVRHLVRKLVYSFRQRRRELVGVVSKIAVAHNGVKGRKMRRK